MFRKKNKKKNELKVAELIPVNGWYVLLRSARPIERKNRRKIAAYAVSTSDDPRFNDSVEAIISLDFFKAMASVTIQKIDDTTIEVKIK